MNKQAKKRTQARLEAGLTCLCWNTGSASLSQFVAQSSARNLSMFSLYSVCSLCSLGQSMNQSLMMSASSSLSLNTRPLTLSSTNSGNAGKLTNQRRVLGSLTNQRPVFYLMAATGRRHPNMSTTFIGRSRPEDEVWRHTPRWAEASILG